ncbi:hypothetical protein P879_02232 [Paragonimus westermani]|uniref:Uncharacterized protein n=1 Tax=Paragonimus westermani TaxID=34504 RepID=A0A8T0D2Y3_9TREM|nr:hypothetical protein P879_02232 [Paragonimus westermani]
MSTSPNREKVLLNLKWFVHRLIRSFEGKLISVISRSPSVGNYGSAHSSPINTPVNSIFHTGDFSELPLLRHLLEEQFHPGKRKSFEDVVCSQYNVSCKKSPKNGADRSPLMRIRSLTNSPLFRKLSLSGQSKRKSLLFQCESPETIEQVIAENKVDILKSTRVDTLSGRTQGRGWHSDPQSPVSQDISRRFLSDSMSNIARFYRDTNGNDRQKWVTYFAQQLCVIYEYQIGMLRGLRAIHFAADYVADVILKAIHLGKITKLDNEQLNATIFFDDTCRPSGYFKCVKTCPLAVTNEQLTWRLGEIWTLAGLRHNEVGGENCHNLSIVTHFLSASTGTSDLSRSDIYGYRNLILFLKHNTTVNSNSLNGSTETPHLSLDSSDTLLRMKPSESYFDLAQTDYLTISSSKVPTGARKEPADLQEPRLSKSPKNTMTNSPGIAKSYTGSSLQSHKRTPNVGGTSTIRQHLHRAYRPVFFVIYNRPSVIEHLTECDSFAAFCKRQSLSPVMFLNQPTTIFDEKPYPCVYQNFDLFKVTVSGYCTNDANLPVPFADVQAKTNAFVHSPRTSGKSRLWSFPYISQTPVAAYDNPGFSR